MNAINVKDTLVSDNAITKAMADLQYLNIRTKLLSNRFSIPKTRYKTDARCPICGHSPHVTSLSEIGRINYHCYYCDMISLQEFATPDSRRYLHLMSRIGPQRTRRTAPRSTRRYLDPFEWVFVTQSEARAYPWWNVAIKLSGRIGDIEYPVIGNSTYSPQINTWYAAFRPLVNELICEWERISKHNDYVSFRVASLINLDNEPILADWLDEQGCPRMARYYRRTIFPLVVCEDTVQPSTVQPSTIE